jgi:hypothetical protein
VQRERYSIGYVQIQDVTPSVTTVTLKNTYGDYVKPSAASSSLFLKAYGVLVPSTSITGTYEIDYSKSVRGSYALVHLVYAIAPTQATPGDTSAKQLLSYVLVKGSPSPAAIMASGYVSIGPAAIAKAKLQVETMN